MATRLRSPPEMPRMTSLPTHVSAAATRPRSAMTSSTARFFSSRGTSGPRRSCAANMSVSRTVDKAKSASSCSTYALMRAIWPGVSTSRPSASTVPVISAPGPRGTRNASALSKEVLPLPLGPMSASREPPSVSPLMCDRMVFTSTFGASASEDASVGFFVALRVTV